MAVLIPLTRGKFAMIDDGDADLVRAFNWNAHPSHKRNEGYYAVSGRGGRKPTLFGLVHMHRLIIGAREGQLVDHVNGDGLDNRRGNLRIASRAQNNINRATPNHTGFRGVHFMPEGNYRAGISVARRRIYSGRFATPVEAARAYDELAIVHHGEFARLNFPRAA